MTGGQMQVLLAEFQKINNRLSVVESTLMKIQCTNPTGQNKPKGETKPVKLETVVHLPDEEKPAGESAESHSQIDLVEITKTIEEIEKSHSQNDQEPIVLHKSDVVEVKDVDELAREIKARRF